MRRTLLSLAGGTLGVLLVSGPASAVDTVVLESGHRYPGKVVRDDVRGVTLVKGGAFEWRREQVREVVYDGGRPDEYRAGRASLDAGRWGNALIYLEAALDGPHHELLEQYVLVHMGRCLERLGRRDEAIEQYEKLHAKGESTRFLPEAIEWLADLYEDPAKLPGIADEAGKVLPEHRALALRALVEEKAGRFEAALDIYRRAMRKAPPAPGGSDRAAIGAVRCLVALKRHEEAARLARDVTRSTRSAKALAGAYVLLGDALQARASTSDDYEEALLAYLRVVTLYTDDADAESRALRGAARCYARLPGPESAARARRLLAVLREKHPENVSDR